ncbi:Gfo/Idh/MocA family protein [Robertkochia flava]|uniref:Gfo/Idh/MocA family protein n=1 Tax=Robertkochia flava TaxID=3447986 RepID=UPI001CC90BBA|nr:Gfo/Idh/MocA family oxidoreductase [Robertkochia marina]
MKAHNEKIRWGIVGLGKIAGKFAADLALDKDAELVAVASTSLIRAQEFAELHHAKIAFGSYEELFACPEVDVVYVANVHSQHANTSISAMQHGKHVLCEKPAGINAGEVQEMINVSRNQGVFFMEALWSRFNPSIRKVKNLIDEGVLGTLRYVHADFCFYALDRDENGRLLNPALGGGSLLDIGIYPVFLAYLLLGLPDEMDARARFFHTGAEVQTSMLFTYPKAQAILHSSLANNAKMEARITGENGEIYIDPRWHEASGFTLIQNGEEKREHLPVTGKGYFHEIGEVHQCIRRGVLESELWSHYDSLQLIRLLDQVRERCEIHFPSVD